MLDSLMVAALPTLPISIKDFNKEIKKVYPGCTVRVLMNNGKHVLNNQVCIPNRVDISISKGKVVKILTIPSPLYPLSPTRLSFDSPLFCPPDSPISFESPPSSL